MTTKLQRPPQPFASAGAIPASPPLPTPQPAQASAPKSYWGDRLTLIFWLLCFGLMLAMSLIEAAHRLYLVLMGKTPGP